VRFRQQLFAGQRADAPLNTKTIQIQLAGCVGSRCQPEVRFDRSSLGLTMDKYVCVDIHIHIHIHIRTYTYTYIHTYIHMHIHVHTQTKMHYTLRAVCTLGNYARRMGQPTQKATNYTARSNIVTAQIFLHANGQRPNRAMIRQRSRRRQRHGEPHTEHGLGVLLASTHIHTSFQH